MTKREIESRIAMCPYRNPDGGCMKYEGYVLNCDGACGWVNDYVTLKEKGLL